jgi:VanZ family protein
MRTFIYYYIPPLLMMGVIYLLSSQSTIPGGPTTLSDYVIKKIAHMFEYGFLYWLWFRPLHRKWYIPLIICLFYAMSDEWHQSFTPNRSPRLTDILFDTLGAWLASLRLRKLI